MAVLGAVLIWHLAGLAAWQIVRQGVAGRWIGAGGERLAGLVCAAGILPGIFLLYNLWVSYSDPYVRAWTEQNLIHSPHFLPLCSRLWAAPALCGLGRAALAAGGCLDWLAATRLDHPVSTAGLYPAWLAKSPDRRCVGCLDYPGNADALEGLADQPTRRRWVSLPSVAVVPERCAAPGQRVAGGQPAECAPVSPPGMKCACSNFCNPRRSPAQVVLAAYETGNPMPAWAPVRVLVGHGPESIHLSELIATG